MDAGAIILAGGKSTRMGSNKALLKIKERPNIERILANLRPVFPHPILIANEPADYSFLGERVIHDRFPGKGPLAGIHAGLLATPFEVNVIAACDMPFISAELAAALLKKSRNYDAVIPVIEGRQQPLFAVYKKKLSEPIETLIKKDRLRIRDLLEEVNVLYLTEEEICFDGSLKKVFFNMNHFHDYVEALKMVEEESQRKN